LERLDAQVSPGVVVGGGQYQGTVRIIFDGFKAPTSLHRDYVEPV
jgi:hypothetical protein